MLQTLVISNILLWIAVVVLALVVFALARQIGVLYERVAPAGALMVNKQLEVGMDAPKVAAETLSGSVIEIGGAPASGRSQLLFFLSPDCPVCKTLLPVIKSASNSEKDWVDLVLASDGEEQPHAAYVKAHHLESQQYVISEVLGRTYGVGKLPYAVLIDEQGKIASMGIVNSREHLESLFEAKEHQVASIQEYMSKQQNDNSLYTEVR